MRRRLLAILLFSCLDASEVEKPYVTAGLFRVPGVREMSGIAVTLRRGDSAWCLAVSDKKPSIYELSMRLERTWDGAEREIGARLVRTIKGADDLEALAYDPRNNVVWAGSEDRPGSPSVVYRVPLDSSEGIRSFPIDSVLNDDNNGAECLALVRRSGKDELWVGKERYLALGEVPPIHRYRITGTGDSVMLEWVGSCRISMGFHRTQSDITFDQPHERLWVISRELRSLFSCPIPRGQAGTTLHPDRLSFSYDWESNLHNEKTFGTAEGISVDTKGWLYVCFDNNGRPMGLNPKKLTPDSRLIVVRPR